MRLSAKLRLPRSDQPAAGRRDHGVTTTRPTLDEFVGRAADEARQRSATVLELGAPSPGRARHFDPLRYQCLEAPPTQGQRQPSTGTLPLADELFDLALCTEAVASSPEPQGLLTEINRVLVPGGRLFLAAPLIVPECSHGYLPFQARLGLNYLLEASGFTIDEILALERTTSYGVVVAKRHRPGHARVSTTAVGANLLQSA